MLTKILIQRIGRAFGEHHNLNAPIARALWIFGIQQHLVRHCAHLHHFIFRHPGIFQHPTGRERAVTRKVPVVVDIAFIGHRISMPGNNNFVIERVEYKLVALVDKAQGNPLTQRIRGVRQVISDGNGVLLPEIRIRENFRLKPSQYAIFINGIKADEADIPADKLMALPSSETYGEIDGVLGNDPAYGMPVTWIQPAQKAKALNMGYQVIDSASVIATHVNKIVRSYIPDLFNYDDITQLHNRLSSMAPRLAEDLSAALNYSQLLKVYRALLAEGVSLRDIVTIATVLVASSTVTKDHILLAADVRLALRRSITHPFVRKQELTVYTLNNELENLLTNVVNQAQQAGKVMLDSVPVDPNMLNQFQSTMPQVKEQMKAAGKDPVLLVPPQLRPLLARYAKLFAPGLHVLSYNEVPDELELKIMGALS